MYYNFNYCIDLAQKHLVKAKDKRYIEGFGYSCEDDEYGDFEDDNEEKQKAVYCQMDYEGLLLFKKFGCFEHWVNNFSLFYKKQILFCRKNDWVIRYWVRKFLKKSFPKQTTE